ncbi:MAG: acylphosphatase [Akkermansiaceae bacterium]|nr:acylphosphatase [Akkermansiaceae bacterium]
MIARKVIFEGRVQGVGFRYTTRQIATGFDVCGWVRNLPDGTVELHAEGEDEEVEGYLKEILEESAVAHHIKHHTIAETPPLDEPRGFQILS